jgi:hypothetical protein
MTATVPHPASNARLLSLAGSGWSEDDSRTEGVDTAKWTGRESAYASEEVLRDVSGQGLSEFKESYIIFPYRLRLDVQVGDSITFELRGVQRTRKVRQVSTHDIAGTVRVSLETA